MKRLLLILFLIITSIFSLFNISYSHNSIEENNIISVDVTFDYYKYHTSKYHDINEFHFLDHDILYINNYTIIDDITVFRNYFFNLNSGTKLYVSYLKDTYEIVELRVNDTYYISLDSSIAGFKRQDQNHFAFLLMNIPAIIIVIGIILLKFEESIKFPNS